MDQVNQFILSSGSVTDQGTQVSAFSLYNLLHKGLYIFSTDPSTLSDHFTTNMVDISPSIYLFLSIDPSGSKPFICRGYCFFSPEKKLQSGLLPLVYHHYSTYWSSFPWYWNLPSVRFCNFNYLLNEYFQQIYVENSLTTQYPCE